MAKKISKPTDTDITCSSSFSMDSFIHDIVNGNYVLVLGSEVMLKKEICNGDSTSMLLNDVKDALIEKGVLSENNSIESFNQLANSHTNLDTHVRDSVNKRLDFLTEEMDSSLKALLHTKMFRVVLTTTIDPYVLQLMEEVWGKGNVDVKSINDKQCDNGYDFTEYIQDDIVHRIKPTLYYIFGKAFPLENHQRFVVSDNDAIEVISKWLSKEAPVKFLSYIRSKRMLALGCKFDDWFFRFFWYSLHGSVQDLKKGEVAISCNPQSEIDAKLKSYLVSQHIYFRSDARKFMDEVIEAWGKYDLKKHILEKRTEGEVFLSYANEDFDIVSKLFFRLHSQGIKVWFDNKSLEEGDNYKKKIPEAINRCKLFIPILSSQTESDITNGNWRYYKDIEWATAQQRHNVYDCSFKVLPVRLVGFDFRNEANISALPECMNVTMFDMTKQTSDELITHINKLLKM